MPGGSARPATYAANMPTTMEKTNQSVSSLPIVTGPFGSTVTIMAGPLLRLATNSGEPMSFMLAGRGNM